LQSLVSQLEALHQSTELGGDNILNEVKKTARDVRRRIKDAYSADMDEVLKKLGWPKPDIVVPSALQQHWERAVTKLLDLQMPELNASVKTEESKRTDGNLQTLFPFEVLVQPLEMRFRYHFEGDRPTNKLDKPEYFLSHVISLLNQHNDFVVDNMQPLLFQKFRGTDLALNAAYIDATSAFITALLPMLRRKILSTLPKVTTQPQLMSHLIHEVTSFDKELRNEWRYDGGYGMNGWKGLAWEVLSQNDWFARWLQVEKDCMRMFRIKNSMYSLHQCSCVYTV
jgi:RAD50-interacting protein 1